MHCKTYRNKVFPEIEKKYISTGQIAYVIREYIGNKQDLDASILARCSANSVNYTKLIDQIFKQQELLYDRNYRELLTNIGILEGVTAQQYDSCLNNDALIETLLTNTMIAVREQSFQGTPSIFINGRLYQGVLSLKELINTIDKELK